jgi:hypothetical protein
VPLAEIGLYAAHEPLWPRWRQQPVRWRAALQAQSRATWLSGRPSRPAGPVARPVRPRGRSSRPAGPVARPVRLPGQSGCPVGPVARGRSPRWQQGPREAPGAASITRVAEGFSGPEGIATLWRSGSYVKRKSFNKTPCPRGLQPSAHSALELGMPIRPEVLVYWQIGFWPSVRLPLPAPLSTSSGGEQGPGRRPLPRPASTETILEPVCQAVCQAVEIATRIATER